jgi:hypothetical protein
MWLFSSGPVYLELNGFQCVPLDKLLEFDLKEPNVTSLCTEYVAFVRLGRVDSPEVSSAPIFFILIF